MYKPLILAGLAVLCAPNTVAAAEKPKVHMGEMDSGTVHYRHGGHHLRRVVIDGVTVSNTGKLPDPDKRSDIKLKPGILSEDDAKEQRDALKPLEERTDTNALRAAEEAYLKDLRSWAFRQDDRFKQLKRIRKAYDRLKTYRDGVIVRGDDVSRIDPRLQGMKKKMTTVSEDIQLADYELKDMLERYQHSLKIMSHLVQSKQEAARAIVDKIGSSTPGSGDK